MRYRWPNGNQCAVVLTVDPDAESGLVFNSPEEAATRLDGMEERRFGVRTGVPRILRLLAKYQLPATFFVPGYTIVRHTAVVKSIQAAGYELGAHGNIHEPPHLLDDQTERRVMQEQLAIFDEYLGVRPLGYRAPGASLKVGTSALLKEFGFVYHSNLGGDDIPYFLDTPHGRLVEIPTSWLLNDAPLYRHVYGATNAIADPDRVVRMWVQEFRAMNRENGCYVLVLHPWIIGRASRMEALERVIRAIREEPGVWWATALEVAQWALETGQNAELRVQSPGACGRPRTVDGRP